MSWPSQLEYVTTALAAAWILLFETVPRRLSHTRRETLGAYSVLGNASESFAVLLRVMYIYTLGR